MPPRLEMVASTLTEKLVGDLQVADDGFGPLRKCAQRVLMQHGFPHRKTENWKYTPLSLLEKRAFVGANESAEWPEPVLPPGVDGVVHLHNGHLDPSRCRLPEGVSLDPLTPQQVDLEMSDPDSPADAFAWLNLARLNGGWCLRADSDISAPLFLAETFSDDYADASHPRIRLELGEGASLTLLQSQQAAGAGLVNGVFDIELAPHARLRHLVDRPSGDTARIQQTRVRIDAGADYRTWILDGGGALTRQDLMLELEAPDAHGSICGAAILRGRSLVDYHTAINHRVGPGTSEEDFRILADDVSTGVFNGRILIVPGADGSDSTMNTGNLLLSENARINIKPELEIHAEEVSASHGATIGQLDDMAQFYLRSRGLSGEQAVALLKYGFAAAAFESLDDDDLHGWLMDRLRQNLGETDS